MLHVLTEGCSSFFQRMSWRLQLSTRKTSIYWSTAGGLIAGRILFSPTASASPDKRRCHNICFAQRLFANKSVSIFLQERQEGAVIIDSTSGDVLGHPVSCWDTKRHIDLFVCFIRVLLGDAPLTSKCEFVKDQELLDKLRKMKSQRVAENGRPGSAPSQSSRPVVEAEGHDETSTGPRFLRHWVFRESTIAHWWILRAISLQSQEANREFARKLEAAMTKSDGDARDRLILDMLIEYCQTGIHFANERHYVAVGAAIAIFGPSRPLQRLDLLLRELRDELTTFREALES